MRFKEVKKGQQGPVSGEEEVVFEISAAESEELRRALKIVDKYRLAALRNTTCNTKNSDWVMVDYSVKNDKVVVKVSSGACG